MKELVERIRASRTILLSTHREPDGDGIGSILALGMALREAGHVVLPCLPDPCPERFRFLDRDGILRHLPPDAKTFPGTSESGGIDLALILDTHQWDLLGRVGEILRAEGIPTLFLDHHPVNGDHRSDVMGDAGASSTGELVFRLLHSYLDLPIDEVIGQSLYTSIAYDTHSFRYVRNSPSPHLIAADMLSRGVDANHVYRHLFASNPVGKMRLLGRILTEIRIVGGGKLAWAEVPLAWIREGEVSVDDLHDAVNYLLEVEGIEIALLLKEVEGGEIRVSIRSKGRIEIHEVAHRLGGGGHPFAAGATLHGELAKARRTVIEMLTPLVTDAPSEGCCGPNRRTNEPHSRGPEARWMSS